MNKTIVNDIKAATGASKVVKDEILQPLWSDYGYIARLGLDEGELPSVILKFIDLKEPESHPRGWNTNLSHIRKVKSYEVESNWYTNHNKTNAECRTPKCLLSKSYENQHAILLEDLDDSGFPIRKSSLNIPEVKTVLHWLANFHATHLGIKAEGLWKEGTYWHLATRSDEWNEMADGALKNNAQIISDKLKNTHYQTIVHGDAKVANFCFSTDGKTVAAVDFQYVGAGCGMKDVAYFLGSCISENECEEFEGELLSYYFACLKQATRITDKSYIELEKEWRGLYAYAWADFERFLLGWMPTHKKLNRYTQRMVNAVLKDLKDKK